MKMTGRVVSVSISAAHTFSKHIESTIELLPGQGVTGDAHAGATVKHRSRVATDPSKPNLRQVHLVHEELLDELNLSGFNVRPGDIGENITTRGVELLRLPRGAQIVFPSGGILEITGLRNPCAQLDRFAPGLMSAVLERLPDGTLIRKAGIMSVVLTGGIVRVGDLFEVKLPMLPHLPLQCV